MRASVSDVPVAWVLGAPTASGKSAVALDLAERLGLEIVVADAMQCTGAWTSARRSPRGRIGCACGTT
jgi:tRNA delta(2)-isopentenylpyrophosphate transferase